MGTTWAQHGHNMGITWATAHAVPMYLPCIIHVIPMYHTVGTQMTREKDRNFTKINHRGRKENLPQRHKEHKVSTKK